MSNTRGKLEVSELGMIRLANLDIALAADLANSVACSMKNQIASLYLRATLCET